MEYQDAIQAMFDPSTARDPAPAAVEDGGPARRLRDAFEPISMHAVWSPLVHERLAEMGLDFFGTYALGRGAVLGAPSGAVVAATFAAFNPDLIGAVFDQAATIVAPDTAWQATVEATGESLSRTLPNAGVADVTSVADRLTGLVADLDGTGRPLFSGVQARAVPDDPFARLWQATLALREHRGDSHVVAYLSEGFDAVSMNILTELWLDYPLGEYSSTRGWPQQATDAALVRLTADGLVESGALTQAGRRARDAIEARTDALQAQVVDGLGNDLDPVTEQLRGWSAECVAAGVFPPDPRKRAAG